MLAFVLVPVCAWTQGQPQGPEFQVNTYTTGYQTRASLAESSSGFVVVWESYGQDGSYKGVFGQRYDTNGVTLGPEFRVNTYTTGNQFAPSVAADASGNFVVVWYTYQAPSMSFDIEGQRFSASGVPLGSEFLVNSFTFSGQVSPRVAASPVGDFVVVWSDDEGGAASPEIAGRRFSTSGAPLGPDFRVNSYTTGFQGSPALAMAASGDFVAVWNGGQQGGQQFDIFGQRFSGSGLPQGSEFRVNTYTTGIQYSPSVASDLSGDFVVTWQSNGQDGDDYGIFGQRFSNSGAPLGLEFRVNTSTANRQAHPSVASDSAGNFVVAWQHYLPTNADVQGQRFQSSGEPAGAEFRVNTYTPTIQLFAAVSANPSGGFVVAWQSYDGQDGEGSGVFAQRYADIVPVELMRFGVE